MFNVGFWRFTQARAMQWLGRLSTLVMLALFAWVGAGMLWSLTAPRTSEPSVAMETDPGRAAQAIAGRHLFGEAAAPGAVAKGVVMPDITLRGVIAAARPREPAVAVLAIAGKNAVSVREGDEVVPGVNLHRVLAHEVELERDGQIQSLSLPERTKPGAPGTASGQKNPP